MGVPDNSPILTEADFEAIDMSMNNSNYITKYIFQVPVASVKPNSSHNDIIMGITSIVLSNVQNAGGVPDIELIITIKDDMYYCSILDASKYVKDGMLPQIFNGHLAQLAQPVLDDYMANSYPIVLIMKALVNTFTSIIDPQYIKSAEVNNKILTILLEKPLPKLVQDYMSRAFPIHPFISETVIKLNLT